MHRHITSLMFLCCVLAARGQTVLSYWLDDAYTARQTVGLEGNSWTSSINVSGTSDGIHVLHAQIVGDKPSPVTSQLFVKLAGQTAAPDFDGTIRYWIDDNLAGIISTSLGDDIFTIDVSALKDGIHVLHVVADNTSPVTSQLFVKLAGQTAAPDFDGTIRYWIDDDFAGIISTPLCGGIFTIDVSELKIGIHTLHVVAGENASSVMSKLFVRLTAQPNAPDFSGNVRYWIDDDLANIVNSPLGDGIFAVNVSALKDGIHTFHIVAGDASPVTSQLFLKLKEKEQPLFSKYEYWVNSEGISTVGELPSEQSTVQLISLLPVAEKPIRSSCFHFAVEDTSPVIYAQNDIRLRFHLTDGRFSDLVQQYTDYRTKQALTDVIPLEPNTIKSFIRPKRNNIQWLSFEAEAGDTVAFKLSQPATVQVFAPSGAEVFKTSESASVKWGGIHTWEDGTYYLAVHDVTGSQSTMKLEYMHMDKYDVVDWDVHTVGNGGCSTITFKGNGFRDLYAVDLVIAPGDTIHSVDVSHDSDAETAVTFDFTGATLGDYNAVFHFTEEDKPVAKVVTVEEAVDIELATDVTFPSSFLRGTSTTYTIKITNKGNMTAYQVPFYIYIASKLKDSIKRIHLEGLNLPTLMDVIGKDSLDESEIKVIQALSDDSAEGHYFMGLKTKDEESEDSIFVNMGYFIVELAPVSTKVINLRLETDEKVEAWITTPDVWLPFTLKSEPHYLGNRRKSQEQESWFCCYHERIECIANATATIAATANLVATAADPEAVGRIIATIADCAATTASLTISWVSDKNCGKGNNNGEKNAWDKIHSWMKGISAAGLAGCLPWNKLKALGTALDFVTTAAHPVVVTDCITAFAKKKPNCPPKPPHGGDSNPRPPSDPNDIYGYLSEAGSKFIADSVARVNYTIEFENDTTFATAAAHTIVIKDTLDNKVFDLTRFMPTGIRIGSREAFLDAADVVTKNNVTSFVKTIDMRPEINAIAQVDGTFNQKNGIAQWTLQSLDPMTMEPTDDLMQGILPVNYNGTSGIGEVMFEVGVKQGKADGTQIKNRAGIVFDYEEAILTPTWTNIVDAVAPRSFIDEVVQENDSTISFHFFGEDNASGIWKYRFYVQAGQNAPWWEIATDIAPDSAFCYRFYDDIDYGFCVLAVDSAGNVEKKVLQRECNFKAHDGEYEVNVDELPASSTGSTGDSRIYDLSGRRHDEPQEGINIIDNKKVLFRRKN